MNYTDKDIVEGLIKGDSQIITYLFYENKVMRNIIYKKINDLKRYSKIVEYDDVVNDLCTILFKDDSKRLKDFGFRSKLTTWLDVICKRYVLNEGKKYVTVKQPKDRSQSSQDEKNKVRMLDNDESGSLINRIPVEDLDNSSVLRDDMETVFGLMRSNGVKMGKNIKTIELYISLLLKIDLEQLSYEEVSDMLDIKIGTLREYHKRALHEAQCAIINEKKHYRGL